MNKKKILSLALVVALLAIMVGSSLAYFTAQDEVTNTFTIGSVKIEIYENDEATEEDVRTFGSLVPVVNTQDPSQDPSYIKKEVEVKNTGNNAAYVRAYIAIPTALVDYLVLDQNLENSGWVKQNALTKEFTYTDGVKYTVYGFDCVNALNPDSFTNPVLNGAYLASNVDLEEDQYGNLWFVLKDNTGTITHQSGYKAHTKTADGYVSEKVNILVASQAIQAQGFTNGATDALNTGFPTNPWATATP